MSECKRTENGKLALCEKMEKEIKAVTEAYNKEKEEEKKKVRLC
jgi:hypothetical protein